MNSEEDVRVDAEEVVESPAGIHAQGYALRHWLQEARHQGHHVEPQSQPPITQTMAYTYTD